MTLTYLIRTNSLDADERFAKTCAFLQRRGVDVDVFALVKSPSEIAHRTRWSEQLLSLRRWFPSGNFLVLKYLELILRAALYLLTHRGRRWYANFDFMALHLLTAFFASKHNRPIFDLHEMPANIFLKCRLARALFAYLLRRSHVIVCNTARRDALENHFGVCLSDALILRNTPAEAAFRTIRNSRKCWLAAQAEGVALDTEQIVLVGGDTPGRYVRESADVIARLRVETGRDLRLSVIGGTPLKDAGDFVSNTGFIPFNTLAERCVEGGVSLCFYALTSLNNRLCEPNRFYQGIAAGQYVVTFDHPSLSDAGYPFHKVINEEKFETALRACLLRLLDDGADAGTRLAAVEGINEFSFEAQYDAFHAWYPTL